MEREYLLGEAEILLGEREYLLGERAPLLGEREYLLGERMGERKTLRAEGREGEYLLGENLLPGLKGDLDKRLLIGERLRLTGVLLRLRRPTGT